MTYNMKRIIDKSMKSVFTFKLSENQTYIKSMSKPLNYFYDRRMGYWLYLYGVELAPTIDITVRSEYESYNKS